MSRRGWSVGRVSEVAGFARAASRGRDERLLLHVLVDSLCPRELALAVRDALVPERPGARVEVRRLAGARPGDELPDAAVALVAPGSDVSAVRAYARAGVPVGVVVEGALEAPELDLEEGPAALVGVVAASSADALPDKLAAWLVSVCEKDLALAANFPFCRRAVVDSLVSRCALENAVVGVVRLVPGSDLPVMTANQLRLALDVAAAYGRPLEPARACELAAVVGAGLGWRALARALTRAVPGAGTLLRAGVACAGTLAAGAALRLRFEAPDLLARAVERPEEPACAPVLLDGGDPAGEGYVTIGEERA